jgi:pimeloyl-ACP methyl ester carboxylesterase
MKKEMLVDDTQVYIEGNGQDTIVMLHGWPDTHELWQQQIDCFKDNYVCVSFTMPGFSKDDRKNYSMSDVVEKIKRIVDAVSPNEQVILLVHDWGCVFGYEFAMRNSDRVKKMIGLDVGDINSEDLQEALSISQKLMVFAYQIILAISFVFPRSIGNPMARFVAKFLRAKSNMENVHAGMSMPYAMRWFGVNGGMKDLMPMDPSFPFYYAYADKKPMMFHSPQWLQRLLENPKNKVQAFHCGHWIMIDRAEAFNNSALEWLKPLKPLGSEPMKSAE